MLCCTVSGVMKPDFDQQRQQAHALLDLLPAEKLNAVRSLLEVMVAPLAASLAQVRVEEEEISAETAAVLDRARAPLARREGIRHEEVLREFGLTKLGFLGNKRDQAGSINGLPR